MRIRWLRLLAREWPIVVLCLSGAAIGTFVTTLFAPITYDATVHLAVRIYNSPTPFTGANKIMATWANLVESPDVLQQAAAENGFADPLALAKAIVVKQEGAQGFAITVTDANPVVAARVANSLANALVQRQADASQQGDATAQQALLADVSAVQTQMQNVKSSLKNHAAYPPGTPKTVALQTQVTLLQQELTQLQAVLAAAQKQHTSSAASVRIIKAAQPNHTGKLPDLPRNTTYSLGLGFMLALGLIGFREAQDQPVRDNAELRNIVPWPILATLELSEADSDGWVMPPQVRDAFHVDDAQALVVAAMTSGAGSSAAVARVGQALAAAGEDTLLIDADLRQPTLHRVFAVPATPGLTDAVLAYRQGIHEVAVARRGNHLWVMPAGSAPPNPARVLTSQALRATLVGLRQGVKARILLAAPQLTNQTDALLMAETGMGLLVVVDLTTARARDLARVAGRIQASTARVIGCVALTRVAERRQSKPVKHPAAANTAPTA